MRNFYPYYGYPMIIPFGYRNCYRHGVKRLDQHGIFVIDTNSVQLRIGESVNYGINPDDYNQLPCECIILLNIKNAVPEGGEKLPVLLAIPSNHSDKTTAYDFDHILNYSTVDITDGYDKTVKGIDMYENTSILAVLNKRDRTLRFLGFNPS